MVFKGVLLWAKPNTKANFFRYLIPPYHLNGTLNFWSSHLKAMVSAESRLNYCRICPLRSIHTKRLPHRHHNDGQNGYATYSARHSSRQKDQRCHLSMLWWRWRSFLVWISLYGQSVRRPLIFIVWTFGNISPFYRYCWEVVFFLRPKILTEIEVRN